MWAEVGVWVVYGGVPIVNIAWTVYLQVKTGFAEGNLSPLKQCTKAMHKKQLVASLSPSASRPCLDYL